MRKHVKKNQESVFFMADFRKNPNLRKKSTGCNSYLKQIIQKKLTLQPNIRNTHIINCRVEVAISHMIFYTTFQRSIIHNRREKHIRM